MKESLTGLKKIFLLMWLPCLMGAQSQTSGIGGVAVNLMGPVDFFSDFIYTGCLMIGASFIIASLIKYIEHRKSPLMVPISTVIFFLLAGIILLILPFLSSFTGIGTGYSLHFQ